ncbi:MAG: hypothetical protein OER87_01705 [Gammaproteobacteria bacterium]|nr:hypothetical protein [Gammaproteobacteria bacterium]
MKLFDVIILSFLLTACTTFSPTSFDSENKSTSDLKADDLVRIGTFSNEQFILKITGIDDLYLYGSDRQVAIDEIKQIEKREPSLFGYAGGITIGIAIIVVTWAIYDLIFNKATEAFVASTL